MLVKEDGCHLLVVNATLEAAVTKKVHFQGQDERGLNVGSAAAAAAAAAADDDVDTHFCGSANRMKDQADCDASVIEAEVSASASAWETRWNLHGHHRQKLCHPYFLHFRMIPLPQRR